MLTLISISIAVFCAVLCGGYACLTLIDRYAAQVETRIRKLKPSHQQSAAAPFVAEPSSTVPSAAILLLQRLAPRLGKEQKSYQIRLTLAGFYSPSALAYFFGARLLLMLTLLSTGLVLTWTGYSEPCKGTLLATFAGLVGLTLPTIWLDRRIARRQQLLRRALPDFLDLLIVCLESGLSLPATVQLVADEIRIAHATMADELQVVQQETELGTSIEDAFAHFADRSGLDGVRTLNTFIRDAQRFGSELVRTLTAHADMLRFEREQSIEESAQKVAVKILFPMLLLILPAVFVVLAGPAAIRIQQAFSK